MSKLVAVKRIAAALTGLVVVPCSLSACSSSDAGGTSTGSTLQVSNTSRGTCGSTVTPTNHEICPASNPTPDCSKSTQRQAEACGVLIGVAKAPSGKPIELARTSTTKEYSGTGPVDLSCFAKPTWPAPAGASQTVTMSGFARNFANGCDAAGSKIEVYKVKRTGGADDGDLGEPVGTPVTLTNDVCTLDNCKMVVVPSKCVEGMPRIWRKFEYKGLPTETELIVKTRSADGQNGFATLYDYNVYIPNADVKNGAWDHDVRVVQQGDYVVIPTTAYGGQVTPGNGSVAGEIHDCGDVRISGASVDISSKRLQRGYFSDVEDAPLPEPNRDSLGTSSLGLYAAYDVPPGATRVSAVGVVNGELVTLGYYDVRVFPDSITAVSFRGFRPFQAQNAASK